MVEVVEAVAQFSNEVLVLELIDLVLCTLSEQYETRFDEEVSGEAVATDLVDRAKGIAEALLHILDLEFERTEHQVRLGERHATTVDTLKDFQNLIVAMPMRNFLDKEGGSHIKGLDEQVDVLHNRGPLNCLLFGAECCVVNVCAKGGSAVLGKFGFGSVIELYELGWVNES